MALEMSPPIHAVAVFKPRSLKPILSARGVVGFERLGAGNYLVRLEQSIARVEAVVVVQPYGPDALKCHASVEVLGAVVLVRMRYGARGTPRDVSFSFMLHSLAVPTAPPVPPVSSIGPAKARRLRRARSRKVA